MKKLLSLLSLLIATTVFAGTAPFKITNDTILMGNGTITPSSKCFTTSSGLLSEASLCWDNTNVRFSLNKNNLKVGDGAASNKVFMFDVGNGATNPVIRWNNATQTLQFANDNTSFSNFGSGSGGGVGIDFLEFQNVVEQAGTRSYNLDGTLRESFAQSEIQNDLWVLDPASASDTVLTAISNPLFFDSADKNFDSAGSWAVAGAGTNFTTSATHKLGTTSLSLDKDNSATSATIKSATNGFALGTKELAWVWINMPSVSGLSDIQLVFCSDNAVTNCAKFIAATDYLGNAFSTGWNLVKVDSSGTPASTTGTGWTNTKAVLSMAIGVDTSSAGQTYSGILVDALAFSAKDASDIIQLGDAYTIYDGTNSEEITLDVGGSVLQGDLNLASALVNNYGTGTASSVKRSPATSGFGAATFTSGNTGTVNLTTSVRRKTVLRSTASGAVHGVDVIEQAPLMFPVSSVDSSVQIKITDPSDNSANFLNGDKYFVFATYKSNGKKSYAFRQLIVTMDANSSHSGSLTTLHNSGSNSGVAVGDTIVKADIDTYFSLVANSANESFGSPITPSDVQILTNGVTYPYPQNVWANWTLGGPQAGAFKNQSGIGPDLTLTGALSTTFPFLNGFFSTGGFTDSSVNYLHAGVSATQQISGNAADASNLVWSVWFNCPPFDGSSNQVLFQRLDGVNTGYQFYCQNNANVITGNLNGNFFTVGSFSPSTFHNFIWQHKSGGAADDYWIDGAHVLSNAFLTGDAATEVRLGVSGAAAQLRGNLAEIVVLRNSPDLTATEVAQLYQGGFPTLFSQGTLVKHMITTGTFTGQKLSVKVNPKRKTAAVLPVVRQIAVQKQ